MSTTTKNCDECAHFNPDVLYDECPCDKEHRARFYKPRGALDTDYGWKRKCADFREKTPNAIEAVAYPGTTTHKTATSARQSSAGSYHKHSSKGRNMTTPRWYMVNKMGMATLCASKADAEKEAADAQSVWPHMGPHRAVQLVEAADVEAMRAGYAAARLEIESLRARSEEPSGEYPALPSNAFNIDPGSGGNIRGYSADQMRAYVDADRALRASHGQAPAQAAPGYPITRFNPATGSTETALQMAAVIALRDEQAAPKTEALSDAEIDRIVPALEPVSEDFPAEWAVWKDRERIRKELRASHGQAPAQQESFDHGPQAETVAEAARDVGKWLNERPNRPLDLRHVAMLCAHAQAAQEAQEPVEWQSRTRPIWGGNDIPWSPWKPCTKEQAKDYWKTPLLHDWAHEARALFTAPQPSPTPQADSQPAPQGETNAQLDTDSNSSAPGQQRDVAGTVALGQPLGHGSDSTAGDPSAQGDKLLTVAERNIRSFLRSATFKSESDREAALNCVDVLWAAARTQADSVLEDAGGGNWQDISTAPKDGTRFVAVGSNYGLYSETQHVCIAQWFRGCWMEVSDWNETSELKYLTHWMPLPPLPGNAARKQGENHD